MLTLCVDCDRSVYGIARKNPGPRCWPCHVAVLEAAIEQHHVICSVSSCPVCGLSHGCGPALATEGDTPENYAGTNTVYPDWDSRLATEGDTP